MYEMFDADKLISHRYESAVNHEEKSTIFRVCKRWRSLNRTRTTFLFRNVGQFNFSHCENYSSSAKKEKKKFGFSFTYEELQLIPDFPKDILMMIFF